MKIAVFTKNRSNPAYAAARLGAESVAASFGAGVLHYVPETADDPGQQSALIEQALADHVDAIVLAPVHPTAVNAAIHKINAARVPLFGFISRFTEGRCISFVGADDYLLGRKIADYLFSRLRGAGEVVMVHGPPESPTSSERVRGFHAAATAHPSIHIAGNCDGRYLFAPARDAMCALLPGLPQVDGVLAANDVMALAALEALRLCKRRALVVGVNALPDAINAIKRGEMIATADFNAMKMAALATECALRHLRGETVPRELMLPVEIVDGLNYAAWDLPFERRELPVWNKIAG